MRQGNDIVIRNQSEHSIFIHSEDFENPEEESDIHKLCSGFEIVVFNLSEFLADVEESIEMDDKIGLYNLKSRCTIFVSFMKGWGKDCAQIFIF